MAYIGTEPNPGQNREVDDISSSFNGSTTAFTLQVNSQNVSPGSSNNIIVSLGGVVQNPGTDYTIASSTITFTTAPASGLSFFGLVLGQQVDIQSLADGTSPTMSAPTITGDLSIADKIVHTGDTNTAIRFSAADTIAIETAGSNRLNITSAGNVGVSTTSPVAQTNSSSDALTPVLDLKGTGTNNNESGVLQLTRKDHANQGSCIYNSGDDGGLCLRNTDSNGIAIWNGTTRSVYVRNNGTVQFRHASSSDSTGESVNWTSFNSISASSYDLKVMNNAADPAATYSVELKAKAAVDNTTYRHFQCTRNNNSTGVFVVFGNGNVQNANNSYGQTSDVKLKENIVDANSQWDDIKGLRVRNFNFKSDSGYSTHRQIGLIAQEAETVSAGLIESVPDVAEDENGIKTETGTVTKQLKYSVLYMKAIKALQEAQTRIETLETKVAALEAA